MDKSSIKQLLTILLATVACPNAIIMGNPVKSVELSVSAAIHGTGAINDSPYKSFSTLNRHCYHYRRASYQTKFRW